MAQTKRMHTKGNLKYFIDHKKMFDYSFSVHIKKKIVYLFYLKKVESLTNWNEKLFLTSPTFGIVAEIARKRIVEVALSLLLDRLLTATCIVFIRLTTASIVAPRTSSPSK